MLLLNIVVPCFLKLAVGAWSDVAPPEDLSFFKSDTIGFLLSLFCGFFSVGKGVKSAPYS